MAAKPRLTVRLSPFTLHALAYVAARDNLTPAEAARMMLGAQVEATLRRRGWWEDNQDHWRAWLAEQAARGERAEVPDQADYDQLAEGLPAPPPLPAPAALDRPLSATIAADVAAVQRSLARIAGRNPRP